MLYNIQRIALLIAVQYLFLSLPSFVHAEEAADSPSSSSLEQELTFLHEEAMVSIAARKLQYIGKAPSIVTVITDKEIRDMGFQTLIEVLQTVPGIDFELSENFGTGYISMRGSNGFSQTKLLLDGHSLNEFRRGGPYTIFFDLPLKMVKRIEIIRGPGSALYGENAFAGIIDIITREADDINGVELFSGYGDYDTKRSGIIAGKTFGELELTTSFNWHESRGYRGTIEKDKMSEIDALQSNFAQILGFPYFPSSNAPGKMNKGDVENYDSMVKISYNGLKLNTYYRDSNRTPFVGGDYSLVDGNEYYNNDQFIMDLSYDFDYGEKVKVRPRIFYDHVNMDVRLQALPDGTTLLSTPAGPQYYPDGMIGIASVRTRNLGSDIQVDYQMLDNYGITLGAFYQWQDLDNPKYWANVVPNTLESLGGIEEISSTLGLNLMEEYKRNTWSVYMQHIWDIREDMVLTAGIRHDQYNDFAGTTNPRFAFVWEFLDDFTLKALYGQAFRAPSPLELVTINNPVVLGNKGLDPETIKTYELGLTYKPNAFYTIGANYFYSLIRDRIVGVPFDEATMKYENSGGLNIHGVEFEFKGDLDWFLKGSYLFANYSFVSPRIKHPDIKGKEPDIPSHKGNVGVNIGAWKYLNANIHTFVSSNRRRGPEDTRDSMPSYSVTNIHFLSKDIFKHFNASLKFNNILDKDYEYPSPMGTMPSDVPRPGRNVFFELSCKF